MNAGSPSKRPFSHPLFGSSLGNLLKLWWDNGGISLNHFPQYLTAIAFASLRLPFSLVESVAYDRKINRMNMPPPIFIIGHWRTGTTHICNILSRSPRFGFVTPVATGLPHDLLILGKLLKPWLERSIPQDRLIDRVAVAVDSPQEDEFGMANIIPLSFLHGLYFPKKLKTHFNKGVFFDGCSEKEIERWKQASKKYLKKIYLDQGKRQLLIRNPAYTARIPILRKMWLGAKFIHIYRNPEQVLPSMRNYFDKLLPALSLQTYHKLETDTLIFETYKKMMSMLISDLSILTEKEFIEVKYENLVERPIEELERVYQGLSLSGFEEDKPYFQTYLNGIRGYTKNQYHQDPAEIQSIRQQWQGIMDHYGY